MNTTNPFQLSTTCADLEEPLRLVRNLCEPWGEEEAVLSYDGAFLHVDCAGMAVAIRATGHWPGQVRFPATLIMMVAKVPPVRDPVKLFVQEGRFHMDTSSVACVVQPAWSKNIELASNAPAMEVFALQLTHTLEEIEASGYGKMFGYAKAAVDEQIARAAHDLADP
jgi:hypothetical protein